MIKLLFTSLLIFFTLNVFGQNGRMDAISARIAAEGRILYKSEFASWHGSDIFFQQYKGSENPGGYFSYVDGGDVKNIFFTAGLKVKIISTITFDSTLNINTAKVDFTERKMSQIEEELFIMRLRTFQAIKEDSLFKRYASTNFNLIPIIANSEKKVYIITAAKQTNDAILLGNDYVVKFNESNTIVDKSPLHKSLFKANYGKVGEKEISTGYHTHVADMDDFITPTDICTIMLYEKIAKWKEYIVVSKAYFSIWNCETDTLLILTDGEAKDYFNKKEKEK